MGDPPALNHCGGDGGRIGAVHSDQMPGIEADRPGTGESLAEMRVEDLRIGVILRDPVHRGAGIVPVQPAGILVIIGVDIGERKAERRMLQGAGPVVAEAEVGAGPGRDIPVAGAVDKHLRPERGQPGLVPGDHRVDRSVTGHLHPGDEGVEQHGNPVLHQQLVVSALQRLRVDRDPVEQLLVDVAESGLRTPENGFGDPAVDDLLAVGKRAPGGNQPPGAHAAGSTGSLQQQRFRPRAGGGDGGGASARPSADDNDVPIGGNADPSVINPGIHRKVPFVSVCSDYSGMKSGRFQAAALLPPLRVPRKKTEPGRLTP